MSVSIDVSFGELIDKITILEIKVSHMQNAAKLHNVQHELNLLKNVLANHVQFNQRVEDLTDQLRNINGQLWVVEDKLREREKLKIFDEEFITLARSVYITNDSRAKIKRELNEILKSEIVEEKDYQPY